MRVVISQPMYFPWVGLLEQMKLADIFVFYDDVQFVKGSLFNRVQVKTQNGSRWLTVPLRERNLSKKINETILDRDQAWQSKQLAVLQNAYRRTSFFGDMLNMFNKVLSVDHANLAELSVSSMMALAEYFSLTSNTIILRSSELVIDGSSSRRVFDICKHLGATEYITGHGAVNYLDHSLFEKAGIQVRYMRYEKLAYTQQHGDFTPFVSGLDLVANCGLAGVKYICSDSVPWNIHRSI